jgi:sugar fermentation stimulation protein A
MNFDQPLVKGTLLRRYKRFLADVKLDNNEVVVAHCTNSGTMKSCIEEGADVYLSPVNDPKRKTKFTWEMIHINGSWVGVNTSNPNRLAFEAVSNSQIVGLDGYSLVKREVTWGDSRFDLMAKNDVETCFIEVKNVTLKDGDWALFPDAVTTRGKKHLETLVRAKQAGFRACMLYVVQRSDVARFAPADSIDPEYGKTLRWARENGVEIFVVRARVSPQKIEIGEFVLQEF